MSTEKYTSSPEKKNYRINPKKFGSFVLATCIAVGGIGYVAHGAIEKFTGNAPEFSKETFTVTMNQGDNLYDNVIPQIDINEKIDPREVAYYIENMPENADTYADGMLDDGEQVVAPVSYGNTGESPDK